MSSDIAVRVEGLGKKYTLKHAKRSEGLRHAVQEALLSPFKKLRSALASGAHVNSQLPIVNSQPSGEEFWALKNVSFEIKRGEVVGIIGRNGAGKSTLLKILSRITEPTTGRIEINGRVASLLEVGTGFHPELTGRENVYLNGAILGMTRAEVRSKFDEIVAFAEVERFLDTPVKRYSSGMYVRLAFAVAAHLEPEILIIDEVLAVGDAAFQKKCLGKMDDVAGSGRTVLFVSHNMAAVTQLCHRAFWMDGGRLRAAGQVDEVVHKYLLAGTMPRSSQQWNWPGDAPGDERIRLLGVTITQDGQESGIIDINKRFELTVAFAVLKPCRNLIAGFNFYNSQGLCLFGTADWKPNSLVAGVYRKQLTIPPHIFSEERINVLVQLVFYEPDIRSVVQPDVLTFETVDSDHPDSVRGLCRAGWPGLLRLSLPWQPALKTSDEVLMTPCSN